MMYYSSCILPDHQYTEHEKSLLMAVNWITAMMEAVNALVNHFW